MFALSQSCHHLITVDQQEMEEPQSSQATVLHAETTQTSLLQPPQPSGSSAACWKRAGSWRVGPAAARVQRLAQLRQVKVQEREEEDGARTRSVYTHTNVHES